MQKIQFLDKNVGMLRDDGVFIGHRTLEHVFYKFNGFAMSVDLLRKLRAHHCRKIVLLLHKQSGDVEKFEAKPELFLEEGEHYCDRKADHQRIIPFSKFNQTKLTEEPSHPLAAYGN